MWSEIFDVYFAFNCSRVSPDEWNRYNSETPEVQADIMQAFSVSTLKMTNKMHDAIFGKDIERLLSMLSIHNPTTCKVFTKVTGIKIKMTQSGCRAAIIEYVGRAEFDSWQSDMKAKRERLDKEAKDNRESDASKRQLDDDRLSYAMGGSGLVKSHSVREVIEDLISRGFTKCLEHKRGISWEIELYNETTGSAVRFRRKHVIAYIKQRVLELAAK